jgi:hypothetical protein
MEETKWRPEDLYVERGQRENDFEEMKHNTLWAANAAGLATYNWRLRGTQIIPESQI